MEAEMWKTIFSLSEQVKDFSKPLTPKILSDPEHSFVKILLYIYSMESFIFREMNRASRMKDTSKIEYYGAFASALGFIIHCGNQKGCQLDEEFKVFRGLQLPYEEFSQNYKVGETLNLKGFTSTTMSRE